MPLSYGRGTLAEHRACRQDSVVFDVSHLGTVRVDGRRRIRPAPGRTLQRPPPDRAGPGPVHPPARRRRRLGGRRHHRLVAVRRRLRRHAQCLQHRPGRWRPSGARTPPRPAASSPSRARTPGPAWPPWPPTPPPCPGSGSSPSCGTACPAWPPAPATPARTGSSARCRPTPPTPCGRHCWPPASSRPGWAPATPSASRRPCPCTVTSSARASPRCRPGWAGWSGGTRRTFRGRAALVGRAPAGGGPPPGRAGHRGPPASARGSRAWRRTGGGPASVTSGNFSPMLEHGIALGLRRQPRSRPSRRPAFDIEQRGRALPATVVATPFVRPGQWASAE